MNTDRATQTPRSILSRNLIEAAARLSSASLHEAAGKSGALPASLKPLTRSMRICGPALPVRSPPGDNLVLHQAIYAAAPGDVLVVDVGAGTEFGYWGEVMTAAAQARKLGGLIIAGGVRDSQRIVEIGFPVFCAAVAIQGTRKDPAAPGSIGASARIGTVVINSGDLVLGDADGVVAVPLERAARTIENAIRRDEEERSTLYRLSQGETTLAIFGLPGARQAVTEQLAARRRSVTVDGLGHAQQPIPSVSRVGNLLATGGVSGRDPATGAMPESASEQADNMFCNLARTVEAAGGTCDDVVKVTIWIGASSARQVVNPGWLRLFPEPQSRPARHILKSELTGGMLLQCEALAFLKGACP